MNIDPTITWGNILTIVTILISVFGAFLRFNDKLNQKADKEIVERIKENLIVLSNKIDTTNNKLDEIRDELKGYKQSFHNLEKDFLIIKTQHEKNH